MAGRAVGVFRFFNAESRFSFQHLCPGLHHKLVGACIHLPPERLEAGTVLREYYNLVHDPGEGDNRLAHEDASASDRAHELEEDLLERLGIDTVGLAGPSNIFGFRNENWLPWSAPWGQELLVPAADRPRLAQGEFHLLDLVGLEVRLLASGEVVGTVTDLIHAGNDLLAVAAGDRQLLIPFVAAIVPEVKLAATTIAE